MDEVEVARYIAFKDKPETPQERKHKDAMKEQKGALIEALHQKCKCAPALLSRTPSSVCPVRNPAARPVIRSCTGRWAGECRGGQVFRQCSPSTHSRTNAHMHADDTIRTCARPHACSVIPRIVVPCGRWM